MLDVAGVDQEAPDATRFENLEDGDPVDAGGLHRHRVHAAGEQPIGEGFQVGSEGSETAHRLAGVVWADGDPDFAAADVEAGRVGMDDSQGIQVFHGNLRVKRIWPAPTDSRRYGRILIGVTRERAASGEIKLERGLEAPAIVPVLLLAQRMI